MWTPTNLLKFARNWPVIGPPPLLTSPTYLTLERLQEFIGLVNADLVNFNCPQVSTLWYQESGGYYGCIRESA